MQPIISDWLRLRTSLFLLGQQPDSVLHDIGYREHNEYQPRQSSEYKFLPDELRDERPVALIDRPTASKLERRKIGS
ncbi:MAG TPA: hypothetical protein VEG37_07900 [Burkholderiales bacterium]|nr:hypothetical protein [Burkholderiales bacterium]